MNIFEKVKKEGLIFDGAMGSILIGKGLAIGETPELWNLKHPDILLDIHRSYYDAGADVVCANTFGASPINMKKNGHQGKRGRFDPGRGRDRKKSLR